MILSGWILPDLFEIKCKSCSVFNGHIEIVKRYLENLKAKDYYLHLKIMTRFKTLQNTYPYIGLDDFAVKCLGWVKINNNPINIVFIAKSNDLSFYTKKYEKLGYEIVYLDADKHFFKVNIESKELI